MSSSRSLAGASVAKPCLTITWHVEHAQTPPQAWSREMPWFSAPSRTLWPSTTSTLRPDGRNVTLKVRGDMVAAVANSRAADNGATKDSARAVDFVPGPSRMAAPVGWLEATTGSSGKTLEPERQMGSHPR